MQSIKWIATACIVIATISRSLNFHTIDLAFGLVGTLLWTYCAWKMDDKPLIFVNGFCGNFMLLGLIYS